MKKILMFLFLTGFCLVMTAPFVQAEESAAQYSAVESISTEHGDIESRVFVRPGMKRMEMPEATQILRFDKGIMWILMPKQRMYMEKPIAAAPGGSANLKFLERENLGRETVNGVSAIKYKTVAQDPQGSRLEGLSWFTEDGILVRNDMQVQGGGRLAHVRSEITDLKVGEQDLSLFEIPQGFSRFSMPAGMPGGLPGGMKIPNR